MISVNTQEWRKQVHTEIFLSRYTSQTNDRETTMTLRWQFWLTTLQLKNPLFVQSIYKQVSIPVGCVPPACWSCVGRGYPGVCGVSRGCLGRCTPPGPSGPHTPSGPRGTPPDPEADTTPGPSGRHPHPVGRQTPVKNITLPQTSFAGGNYTANT